ncbi:hypothetical protein ACFYNV_29045 [Streptomyces albidoflavus]
MTPTRPRPFTRLKKLAAALEKAEADQATARDALHDAILKHLRARSAPPGKIAAHTPYDRNWVGELGRRAGIPALRGPRAVGPPPKYEPEVQAAALAELDQLTAAWEKAEDTIERTRPLVHKEIVAEYEGGATPEEMSSHVPYDRNWIGEIARNASTKRHRESRSSA